MSANLHESRIQQYNLKQSGVTTGLHTSFRLDRSCFLTVLFAVDGNPPSVIGFFCFLTLVVDGNDDDDEGFKNILVGDDDDDRAVAALAVCIPPS